MSVLKKAKMMEVPIDRLRTVKIQPKHRTNADASMKELCAGIEAVGLMNAIHVIETEEGGWYDIACGNRRTEAHRLLGVKTIRAYVHPFGTDVKELWKWEASGTKRQSPLEWMHAWYFSENRSLIPPKRVMNEIEFAMEVLEGIAGIRYLLQKQTAPSAAKWASRFHAHLVEELRLKDLTKKQVLVWMIETSSYTKAVEITNEKTREKAFLRRVYQAILDGKRLESVEKRGGKHIASFRKAAKKP